MREVVEEEKAFDRILDGKVSIDYETGQVKRAKKLLPRADRVGNATLLSASQTVYAATVRADPAVLHLDSKLLQDTVLLSLATATGGLVASFVRAPHTLGYVVGGMLVGPSGFDLIQKLA